MHNTNVSGNWSRPGLSLPTTSSPYDKIRQRFGSPTGPTTLVDLGQDADKLSAREQDTAQSGQRVYHQVKDHFELLRRADNRSSLDENPQSGAYSSSPAARPTPTFTTSQRWSEAEGPQRTVEYGTILDEGTEAVTLAGHESMAVASTYSNESGRQVPGGMYFWTDGELEKVGLIDRQGKRVEVVASTQGDILTVLESY